MNYFFSLSGILSIQCNYTWFASDCNHAVLRHQISKFYTLLNCLKSQGFMECLSWQNYRFVYKTDIDNILYVIYLLYKLFCLKLIIFISTNHMMYCIRSSWHVLQCGVGPRLLCIWYYMLMMMQTYWYVFTLSLLIYCFSNMNKNCSPKS